MATRLYGIARGERIDGVAEGVGSAVAADPIELTVDLASSLDRQDVLKALDILRDHILKGNWPPA
jgi:hypothetical protein